MYVCVHISLPHWQSQLTHRMNYDRNVGFVSDFDYLFVWLFVLHLLSIAKLKAGECSKLRAMAPCSPSALHLEIIGLRWCTSVEEINSNSQLGVNWTQAVSSDPVWR